MSVNDRMELREEVIRAHYATALNLLEGFEHAPRSGSSTATPVTRSDGVTTGARRFRATTPGLVTQRSARAQGVHVIARIEALDGDALLSPQAAGVLQALRRSLAIAMAVGDSVAQATGLDALKAENLAGRVPPTRKSEFSDLLSVEALAVLYSFANATAFLLAPSARDALDTVPEIDELLVDNAPLALQGALWALDQTLDGVAEGRLADMVLAFCEALMTRVAARGQGAARIAAFRDLRLHVAADDLAIDGFTPARKGRGTPLTMAFKKPDEVIGNHIAKHQAMRLAKMLMAYDFEQKLNPFAELGGFIFTFMGDGAPGTGKTTLIQMMAGLMAGYCDNAGYPFVYRNFSVDQIDSYQGKSGQNARAFVNTVLDPSVIGFGTIDDIDQIAGKRGDRQSSAGQQEVTAVFMEAFAGANTVVRGNCTFGMFSNFPENVDDALRQRAGARFLVDGPQSRADYIDILALLLGKNHDIPLGQHDLNAAQVIQRAVAQSYEAHALPKEAGLRAVWDQVVADIGPLDTLAKLGSYLKAIQLRDPRFTGRAVKNITDAVKVRAMDVELPDAWMEAPAQFLHRSYDEKLGLIRELVQPITVEMVVQEINRYADSEMRYADKSDTAAIEAMVRDLERSDAARRIYAEGKG
ncbi:ATPase family associated with various cellular activities (AAA) [Aquimixticola soesokkakensis]|uniref:ATPase family associated with various cellular activities (AAA) n=1 Tax=Aquimixticola soesokkakensis TaxID=1519096 RepID=A0A1Y5TD50_9RHOB|nr:ATP-binding protein [Aquimixticola soesokkakensis]SLN61000.1 ATPase family associated with various cellular activities (AAA) [Aquimixticola soesokkakensis]